MNVIKMLSFHISKMIFQLMFSYFIVSDQGPRATGMSTVRHDHARRGLVAQGARSEIHIYTTPTLFISR